MKKVGVALLGLGTVGSGTYKILTNLKEKFAKINGVEVEILHILERDMVKVKALGIDEKIVSQDINNILNNKDIKIVAEFFGGIEPARSFLIASLKAGKHIVTANKEMFSKHWHELESAGKEGNAGCFFEASCVGGVPIIKTLIDSMQGNNLQSLFGIVNGTTNYILSKMADEGLDYSDVLKEAQQLGYAEANPSADVDGYDSMYKLSILSSLAFNKKVPIPKIYREGISKISKVDIEYGKKLGYTLKLLAIGKNIDNKIEARVHPAFIPNSHPLATVKGSFNAVHLVGDNVGDVMLYGRGAGDLPTGSAIVSDIIFAAVYDKPNYCTFDNSLDAIDDNDFNNNFECEYYVRMTVCDKSGVLAKIASAFAKYDVSLESVQQQSFNGKASIIFMLHKTKEFNLNSAIKEVQSLNEVDSVESVIRVEH